MSSIHAVSLTLSSVANLCAGEAQKMRANESSDPRFCYELFRRAIVEKSLEAWNHICESFWPHVHKWVTRHQLINLWQESPEALVGEAFERMWRACKVEQFERAHSLNGLLEYLRRCAESALVEQARVAYRHRFVESLTSTAGDGEEYGAELETNLLSPDPSPDTVVMTDQRNQLLWHVLQEHVHDEQERIVMYATFALGQKPSDIYALNKKLFARVNDVYLVKERVVTRLRNDSRLSDFDPKS